MSSVSNTVEESEKNKSSIFEPKINSQSRPVSQKAQDIFRKYQQQAIDFSRRNRLLKYPNNATKIEFRLNLEECEEYFGSIQELAVVFPHKKILDSEKKQETLLPNDKKVELYDPRTTVVGKKLVSVLEKLRLQSKKNFDEHGLQTLFLVIGEIKWKEQTVGKGSTEVTKVQDYSAPLLLIPIELENTKEPYKATNLRINTDQNPVRINPVLLSFIKQNLELRIPDFPEDLTEISYVQIKDFFSDFINIFKDKGINIETVESIYIGQFSFHGQQIYEDLHKNEEKIIQHPFVYNICSGDRFLTNKNEQIKIDDDYNADDFLTLKEDYTVLDADSSQILAIKKVVSGEHLVIHGPPGTGKSQTIANIIVNLLARNKTVLFVCEKQVALDVVYKRLTSEGGPNIADLCLPLFKYTSNKKEFAADIVNSRDSLIREIRKNKNTDLNEVILEREKKIEFLKQYAEEVIRKIEPLGKNLYWVFGQLGKISERSKEVVLSWKGGGDLMDISVKTFFDHTQALKDLNPFLSLLDEKNSQWNGLKKRHFSPDYSARIIEVLKKLIFHLGITPYEKGSIKFESLSKSLAFFVKVSDQTFTRLLREKFLKVSIIEPVYLEKLKQKIQTIADLSLKYKDLDKDRKFKFAEKWNVQKEQQINFLDGEISIATLQSSVFQKSIEWMAQYSTGLSSSLPSEICDLTLKDFESRAFLFAIDRQLVPMLLRSKTDLFDFSNQIKQFQVVYRQMQQVQDTLDKFGVNLDGIAEEEVFRLENNFTQKYKTIFRIFSSQYKKDKNLITSWCGFLKPQSHNEIKILCFAAATRLKLEIKSNNDWKNIEQKFNLNSEIRKLPLQLIQQKISEMVGYLEENALEFVEPYLQKIISDQESGLVMHAKSQIITKLLSESKLIQKYLTASTLDQKISSFENYLSCLASEAVLLKNFAEEVSKFCDLNKENSIQSIIIDVKTLNNLRLVVDRLYEMSPSDYFYVDVKCIVTNEEFLPKTIEFLDLLLKIAICVSEIKFEVLERISLQMSENCDEIDDWNRQLKNQLTEVSELFENVELSDLYLSYSQVSLLKLLETLIEDKDGLETWIEYQKRRHIVEELGLGWFTSEIAGKVKTGDHEIGEIYMWVFFNKWLENYFRQKPILRDFNRQKYEKIIKQFKALEADSLNINRQRVLREFFGKLEYSKNPRDEAERVLNREATKKRQHLPIRTIVKKHAEHLQSIKPCWMVSPLALGSYLEYGSVDFDVVIFDEASQMRIENSLGAISRAKQVVVIGDEHQLPPTPFFGFSLEDDEDEDKEVTEETGFESILQRSISLLSGSEEYLKYHYRSSSEDLIAFSNHYIYDGRLVTFPNPAKNPNQGIRFEFVKDGFYDGGNEGTKTNPKEAERVAELCIKIAEENSGSLGVIAFSKSQEKAIRSALEEKLKYHPHLAEKLDETSSDRESFFIKNLESVQGDERDKIILSVCYGPDKNTGKVRNHFGPINQNNGYRRLNVAVTRAKEQLICITSMHAYDMQPPESTFGAKLLQKYLEYAEKGRAVLEASKIAEHNNTVEADSDFELSVEAELKRKGYVVHRQVGASGFKIDLAIVNPKNNNEYILGIECDGATYHSSKSARIRDRIRQDILEKLGWKIYRIWSQHWSLHKNEIIDDIARECSSL